MQRTMEALTLGCVTKVAAAFEEGSQIDAVRIRIAGAVITIVQAFVLIDAGTHRLEDETPGRTLL